MGTEFWDWDIYIRLHCMQLRQDRDAACVEAQRSQQAQEELREQLHALQVGALPAKIRRPDTRGRSGPFSQLAACVSTISC